MLIQLLCAVLAVLYLLCPLSSFAAARDTQYAEALTEQSYTGDTNWHDHDTLTFTPAASSDYWFFYSGDLNFSNTSSAQGEVKMYDSTGASDFTGIARRFVTSLEYVNVFGMGKYTSSASPASTTFAVAGKTSAAGSTTKLKNVTLLAVKADASDQWAASDTEGTTTSASYQTKTTLTWTPASTGDYLIIAYAELYDSAASVPVSVKMDNGGTAYGSADFYLKGTSDILPWMTMVKLNLANSSQTFTIQYASDGTNTAKIRNARILALRADAFDNVYYAESRTRGTTTSTSFADKTTLTQTPLALEHIVFGCGITDLSTTLGTYTSQTAEGASTALQDHVWRPVNTSQEAAMFTMYRKTLAASSTTWKTQQKVSSAIYTGGMGESALTVLQSAATPVSSSFKGLMMMGVGQ